MPSKTSNGIYAYLLLLLFCATGAAQQENYKPMMRLRRPVSLAVMDGHLFVANQRSGSISVIDIKNQSLVDELEVGSQLADLKVLAGGRYLLAVGQSPGQVILLRRRGAKLEVKQQLKIQGAPVSVTISTSGRFVTVASLWARQLSVLAVEGDPKDALVLRRIRTIDLPFSPRQQLLVKDDSLLVVADGFAGGLAFYDTSSWKRKAYRSVHGHNIAGLAVSPNGKELYISQQVLEPNVPTTRDMVFYGFVIGNLVRAVSFDNLLARTGQLDQPEPVAHWSLYPVGSTGSATGDPGQILVQKSGLSVVCLSGVDEIGIRAQGKHYFSRLKVGRRPVALVMAPDGNLIYVANQFADSISLVDWRQGWVTKTIFLGPMPPLSEVDRGQILFYDAKLSLHGWYSCHSCHTDGHTIGMLNDNFGDDTFGTPKRVLSLLGAGQSGPWAWKGTQADLAVQVRKSIQITMQGAEEKRDSDANVKALTAFISSFKSAPGVDRARGKLDPVVIKRGKRVFERYDCARCHPSPSFTKARTYDVGVHDQEGARKFNPPSLLGVSQLPAFFHNNQTRRLRDVFTEFNHEDGREIGKEELDDLLAYLRGL
jgi:YVTN family beta-propeller protein